MLYLRWYKVCINDFPSFCSNTLPGRTHQLRVHCAHIGHLIVGDYTYSKRQDIKPHRMMLHAYHLNLPSSLESLDITTDDPFTMENEPLWQPTQTFTTYEEILSESGRDSLSRETAVS